MKRLAFTLIEILLVIVVIGIISSFIIVSMSSITQKATIAKGQAFSSSIKNALMSNLVSEWRLDDASGTVAKDFWGTNDGTWSGAGGGSYTSPSWRTSSECVSNGCLAFDGTDDYVDCGLATFNTSSNYTISLWFKALTDETKNLFHKGKTNYYYTEIGIRRLSTQSIAIQIGNGSDGYYLDIGSNLLYEKNVWHNIVVTFNGANVVLYKNGAQDKLATPTGSYSSNAKFSIGRRGEIDTGYFNGLIDDVRIYNASIPTSQIQQNYYSGVNRLLANNSIDSQGYSQRITELTSNLANN